MFIDFFKFLMWLWKKATGKADQSSKEDPKDNGQELETEQVRLILRQAFVKMRPRGLVLYKLIKKIRPGHALEDAKGNGLLMLANIDELNTPPPPQAYLPIPLEVADIYDDMGHFPDSVFEDFWEWPDRAEMSQDAYFCAYMKEHGTMALLCHHIKNSQGSVVAMIAGLYSDVREFSDADKDAMILAGRQLQILLSWLDGG